MLKICLPPPPVIARFKSAAVPRRHVETIGLRWHPADRAGPPAAVRSNVSPAQNRIELSRSRLPKPQTDRETDYDCISNRSHKPAIFFCDDENATRQSPIVRVLWLLDDCVQSSISHLLTPSSSPKTPCYLL